MKDFVEFFIHDVHHRVSGADVFLPVADFLRYRVSLTGTKVVCAEGDCGACTILTRSLWQPKSRFEVFNSCIYFVWQMDGQQIITVEGLQRNGRLHPAQSAMIQCHGAQCGYCTPGVVCSLAQLADEARREPFPIDRKRAQNYLTGNLCRCTGYEPILDAASGIAVEELEPLQEFYPLSEDQIPVRQCVKITHRDKTVWLPSTLTEVQKLCQQQPQIVAGSTDLGVLSNKGKWVGQTLMSLKHVRELDCIERRPGSYLIGANVTLTKISKALQPDFPELSRLLHVFASPQVKNVATLVGNMMNASPIADTIPFLKVADARVRLLGPTGSRELDINDFFREGYKQLDRRPDEIVTHVELPCRGDAYKLYKVSRRKDLDISAVTAAFGFRLVEGRFQHFAMAFGGIATSVIRFKELESSLLGQPPTRSRFVELADDLLRQLKPLNDVRGSAEYRRTLVKNLLLKLSDELAAREVAG